MKKTVSWIVNHPVISVILLVIAIALLMPKVNTLELNSDMEQFLPAGDPQTEYYEHFFKDTFGSDVLSIVVVKPKAGNVFTHETLTLVETLTEEFAVIASVTGLLIILALFGLLRLSVNNDYLGFFKQNSPIRKDLEKLNRDLSGLNVINVIFNTEDDGDILEPEVLKQIDGLQQFMQQLGTFDKTVSLADHIKLMHREMNEGREEMRRIPDSRPAIAQYLLLMDYDTLAEYIDSERRHASVLVLHNLSGSRELAREMDKVRTYIDKNIRGYGKDGKIRDISIMFTGLDYLMKNSTDAIVRGQVNSLGIALVVIFILMTIVFFSVKGGLIAIISNIIPILINFGIMGWFGIALTTIPWNGSGAVTPAFLPSCT